MADPTTVNRSLYIPTRGSDPGTWDVPMNANFSALDTILGADSTLTVSTGIVTLTSSQIAYGTLTTTGTLSGDVTLLFPNVQGWWTINNSCVVGNYALFVAAGTGLVQIGIPPGEFIDVFVGGNQVYYRNFGRINRIEIWAGYSALPAWCVRSTTSPYGLSDGSIYNISTYPISGKQLGSSFGGDGISTFGVPDLRGRIALPYDGTGARVTSAGCGISGTTLGAAGGDQLLQAHTHTYSGTTGGMNANNPHSHPYSAPNGTSNTGGGSFQISGPPFNATTGATDINHGHTYNGTTDSGGGGASQNMIPAQVTGIAVIRLA